MISPLSDVVKDYIREYTDKDVLSLILAAPVFQEVSNTFLAAQILGRRAAQKKFPSLLDIDDFIYPTKVSLEQASSEQTARYKAELIDGVTLVDLTGGMGVDLMFLGKNRKKVTYVEPNKELYELAQHNLPLLDIPVESYVHSTAEGYLQTDPPASEWVYIDPSRRIDGNRSHDITDLVPDVVGIYPLLKKAGEQIMIKLSPMQHIDPCLLHFPELSDIYCISLNGELKEVLLLIRTCGHVDTPNIHSVLLGKHTCHYTFPYKEAAAIAISHPKKYIYQPDPAIMKAGIYDNVALEYSLEKLHPYTHLYTSDTYEPHYSGRIYEVVAVSRLQKKELQEHVPDGKAHIVSKNFPLSSEAIRKKLKLKDGGNTYLLCFTDHKNKKSVLVTTRLK